MPAMHRIDSQPLLAPFPGRFASVRLVEPGDAERADVERFIADIYLERYGARLRSFLPHLLAYRDCAGALVAAVGLRCGSEGRLFVEQYLDVPVEQAMAARRIAQVERRALVEVGNFAATTPGIAREMILQLTCTLHAAGVAWVLFVATRQLRNAFLRLHLSPLELADARADALDAGDDDWGDYYAAHPRLACGNVAEGFSLLRGGAVASEPVAGALPALCMAVAQ